MLSVCPINTVLASLSVVEAVVKVREEATLEKLEALVKRASELRSNLNALASAIETKYSSDPRFGSFITNVLKAVRPKEPPNDQLLGVSSSLEKYIEDLERSVKMLTEYVIALDKLQEGLAKLERELGELQAWSELLRELAPHLAAETSRLTTNAQRLLFQPPLEDLRRLLDEVELTVKEAKSHNRVCKTVYINRANELLSRASQLLKTIKRIRGGTSLLEAGRLQAYEEALAKIVDRLVEATRRPLEVKLDLVAMKAEIEAIEREASVLGERVLSEEEEATAKEIERIARGLGGRVLTLSALLEVLSRRTGLPTDTVVRQLLTLEKKGFVTVQVKLTV